MVFDESDWFVDLLTSLVDVCYGVDAIRVASERSDLIDCGFVIRFLISGATKTRTRFT